MGRVHRRLRRWSDVYVHGWSDVAGRLSEDYLQVWLVLVMPLALRKVHSTQ
jgi:hypothetical protein